MTNFLKEIQSVMKEQNITIYSLAASSEVERSLLSKILSGKRSLSPEHFLRIIEAIPMSVDKNKELRDLYIDENFGRENFMSYINFVKELSESTNISQTPRKTKTTLNINEDAVSFSSQREFYNIAEAVIDREVSKENSSRRIYTNIFSDTFFYICKSFLCNQSVDFRQLIGIKKDKQHFIKIISQVLSFSMLGYPTHYYNTESDISEHIGNVFSHYIITSDICVFADSNFEYGYLIKSHHIADISSERFLNAMNRAKPYLSIFNNILESKAAHEKILISETDKIIFIEDELCTVLVMTKDMWAQIAKPDVPNREYLIDSTYEYYQKFYNSGKSRTFIGSKTSIEKFVNDGIVPQMPKEYALPLTLKNRLKILELYKDMVYLESNEFYLIKDSYSEYIKNFVLEIFDKTQNNNSLTMILGFASPNADHHYLGNLSFSVSDRVTITDLENFIKYLVVSSYCYTKEESIAILNEEIEKCRYKLAAEENEDVSKIRLFETPSSLTQIYLFFILSQKFQKV